VSQGLDGRAIISREALDFPMSLTQWHGGHTQSSRGWQHGDPDYPMVIGIEFWFSRTLGAAALQ
jgi:hypothetical protein